MKRAYVILFSALCPVAESKILFLPLDQPSNVVSENAVEPSDAASKKERKKKKSKSPSENIAEPAVTPEIVVCYF